MLQVKGIKEDRKPLESVQIYAPSKPVAHDKVAGLPTKPKEHSNETDTSHETHDTRQLLLRILLMNSIISNLSLLGTDIAIFKTT